MPPDHVHPMAWATQEKGLADVLGLSRELGLLPLSEEQVAAITARRAQMAERAWANGLARAVEERVRTHPRLKSSAVGRAVTAICYEVLDTEREVRDSEPAVGIPFDRLPTLVGLRQSPRASVNDQQREAYDSLVAAEADLLIHRSRKSFLKATGKYAAGTVEQKEELEQHIAAAGRNVESARGTVERTTAENAGLWRSRYLDALGESPDGRSAAEIRAHRTAVAAHIEDRMAGDAPETAGLTSADLHGYRRATNAAYASAVQKQLRAAAIIAMETRPEPLDAKFEQEAIRRLDARVANTEPGSGDRSAIDKVEVAAPHYFENPLGDRELRTISRNFSVAQGEAFAASVLEMQAATVAQYAARRDVRAHAGAVRPRYREEYLEAQLRADELAAELEPSAAGEPESPYTRHGIDVMVDCSRIDTERAAVAKHRSVVTTETVTRGLSGVSEPLGTTGPRSDSHHNIAAAGGADVRRRAGRDFDVGS